MHPPLDDSLLTPRRRRIGHDAFTLVELLVAMAVLSLMVVFLFSLINRASAIWVRSRNEVSSYQSARFAFNLMTRTLAQSRMNVYQDYDDNKNPTAYLRKSDLDFVIDGPQGTGFGQGNSVFFQAPLGRTADTTNYGGLPGVLNTVGYYVTYGKDPSLPAFLSKYDRNRFRLMQLIVPTENMTVYTNTTDHSWYTSFLPGGGSTAYVNVVANNVILLLCWPRLSAQEDAVGDQLTQIQNSAYLYDSRLNNAKKPQPITANQQPPLVQVTLVALDETLVNRLPDTATPPTQVTNALSQLFTKSTVTDYKNDLATLESRLTQANIGYRVFNSTVPILEAKWSKPPTP